MRPLSHDIVQSELDLLVYWIRERESVRRAKEAGHPKPWTEDPILQGYRWCNVRRMDDRVSQELFARWYSRGQNPARDLAEAVMARLINWPEALDELDGSMADARRILRARAARGGKVFTAAYLVPGVPGRDKVDSVCALVDAVASNADRVLKPSMRATWAELIRFDGLGSFLAGQVVADLAHLGAGRSWNDSASWAPIGPGSARGINRLRGIPKDKPVSQEDFDVLLPQLIGILRPLIEVIWGDRNLQAMDVQNCLCEYDKSRRLQLGEGHVRSRYDGGAPAQRDMFS